MRRARTTPLLALVALLATLAVAPAGAEPDSDELRGDLRTAQERLQEIEMEASVAVEDYNEARARLDRVAAELAETEERIEALRGEVDSLSDAAALHVRRLHKLGPTLELSAVFVAGETAEIGSRSAALRRVLDGQRADLEGLAASTRELEAAEDRLAQQRAEAAEHEDAVAGRQADVEATLASFEGEVAELTAAVEEAEEREEREAEEERRRAAEERAEQERAERERAEAEAAAEAEREAAEAEPAPTTQDPPSSASADSSSTSDSGSAGDGSSTGGSDEPAPSSRQSARVAVDTALDQVGKPYQWGGSGPDSFDCSGLTSYAWRAAGVEITRTSRSQWDATRRVDRSELQPGDLVFYSRDGTRNGIGHVAMYIGGGDIVEAPYSGNRVRVRSDGLSRSDILGYGRV